MATSGSAPIPSQPLLVEGGLQVLQFLRFASHLEHEAASRHEDGGVRRGSGINEELQSCRPAPARACGKAESIRRSKVNFVDVCALEDVPAGGSRPARVKGRDLALFRVEEQVFAIENSCPHQGAALTGGSICGRVVSCPAHGLRLDVSTGAMLAAPELRVECFPVRLSDGRVFVGLAANALGHSVI